MQEILKAVVVLRRAKDDRDIIASIVCIPADEADRLEAELKERKEEGYLEFVQMGKTYVEATPKTDYVNEVDSFLSTIDE